MTFPFDYDEDEVRDGFYVAGMTKRVWASQTIFLEKFQKFCEQHNLRWFMAYGTLLGAVRHKGFVPWDDDTDIWMLREDFNELYRILKAHPECGFVIRESRDGEYDWFVPVLAQKSKRLQRVTLEENIVQQNFDCPYLPCVDTFVLDHVSEDKDDESWRDVSVQACINLMAYLDDLADAIRRNTEGSDADLKRKVSSSLTVDQIEAISPDDDNREILDNIRATLAQIDVLTAHKFDADKPLRAQVNLLYTGLIAYFHDDEGSMLRVYPEHLYRKLDGYPKS